jgi:hypothetical protein
MRNHRQASAVSAACCNAVGYDSQRFGCPGDEMAVRIDMLTSYLWMAAVNVVFAAAAFVPKR